MRRLIVWRAGALGDTISMLPALGALRRHYPAAHLDVIGTRAYLGLARDHRLADRVWDAGSPLFAGLFRTGPAGEPGAELSAWLAGTDLAVLWSGAAATMAAHLRAHGVGHVVAAPPLPTIPQPIAGYLVSCLGPLGVPPRPLPMPLLRVSLPAVEATEARWREAARAGGAGTSGGTVILHPGAGAASKRWPLTSFVALARIVRAGGGGAVWTQGPADGGLSDALRKLGEQDAAILDDLEFPALCALLARAAAVVAPDTGVAHLAAALGRPTLALFGPTDERVWAPWGPHVTVLRGGACFRPPATPTSDECPAGPCCLRDLKAEGVADRLRPLMQ